MANTKVHCCDGTDLDVTGMSVEDAVARLKELNAAKTCGCVLLSEHDGDKAVLEFKRALWRVGRPHRKRETGEWVVPVYDYTGTRDEGKTYYTDDKDDALATYRDMLKWAEKMELV